MATVEVGNLQDLWNAKFKQLHGLAVSIATERERGNEVGVAAMRPVFAQVAADLNDLNRRLYNQEMDLGWTNKFLLAVDSGVTKLAGAIPDVAGSVWDHIKPFVYIGIALYAAHLLVAGRKAFR